MQVDGTTYYYITNLQGDVMGLVDASGNSVASYTYDPIDRFGEDVSVIQRDENTFTVAVEVAQSPTFFAWVFTYSGEMEILAPESMRQAYRKRLRAAQQLPF